MLARPPDDYEPALHNRLRKVRTREMTEGFAELAGGPALPEALSGGPGALPWTVSGESAEAISVCGSTCPRKISVGRTRTARTSTIIAGLGSGGRAGDAASKASGGISTL